MSYSCSSSRPPEFRKERNWIRENLSVSLLIWDSYDLFVVCVLCWLCIWFAGKGLLSICPFSYAFIHVWPWFVAVCLLIDESILFSLCDFIEILINICLSYICLLKWRAMPRFPWWAWRVIVLCNGKRGFVT